MSQQIDSTTDDGVSDEELMEAKHALETQLSEHMGKPVTLQWDNVREIVLFAKKAKEYMENVTPEGNA